MKQKDVVIGETYLTRIGEELARVVVVSIHADRPYMREKVRTTFTVRREGETVHLPKRRTAAALREVGGS